MVKGREDMQRLSILQDRDRGRMCVVNGKRLFDGFVLNVKEVLLMVTADLVVELTIDCLITIIVTIRSAWTFNRAYRQCLRMSLRKAVTAAGILQPRLYLPARREQGPF
jgi:hypothetical protein